MIELKLFRKILKNAMKVKKLSIFAANLCLT